MRRTPSKTTMFPPADPSKVKWYTGNPLHDTQHREEMRQIAQQQIKEIVPQIAKEIYRQSLNTLIKGLQYDIETAVNIAFDDGRNIFTDSHTKKIVSDAVLKEIKKSIDKIVVNI